MTVPVTQLMTDGKMSMGFFLAQKYSKQNAPEPINERIRIIGLTVEYFAVISYSGFVSDCNFERHHTELKTALNKDSLVIKGSPIKASYNSTFTLPFLRRNEAMYPFQLNYITHPFCGYLKAYKDYKLTCSSLCSTTCKVNFCINMSAKLLIKECG